MHIELHALRPNTIDFDGALAVYAEYAGGSARSHRSFFMDHVQRPDYVGFVARHKGKVIGMTFGEASLRGQWWHDVVAKHVGINCAALQEAWVLTQLNVLRDYRNHGIGAQLHDAIVAQQPHHQLLLSTQQSNRAAQRFYQRRGWVVLHPGIVFSRGDEPYMIMRKTKI